jgi:hypothetical protein
VAARKIRSATDAPSAACQPADSVDAKKIAARMTALSAADLQFQRRRIRSRGWIASRARTSDTDGTALSGGTARRSGR